MSNAILGCEERDSLSRGGWGHRKISCFEAGKLLGLAGAGFYECILDKPNSGVLQNVGWFTCKIVPGIRDVLVQYHPVPLAVSAGE